MTQVSLESGHELPAHGPVGWGGALSLWQGLRGYLLSSQPPKPTPVAPVDILEAPVYILVPGGDSDREVSRGS